MMMPERGDGFRDYVLYASSFIEIAVVQILVFRYEGLGSGRFHC